MKTIIILLAAVIFCLVTRRAGVLSGHRTIGVWSEIGGRQSWSITIKDRVVFVHVDFRGGREEGNLWILL